MTNYHCKLCDFSSHIRHNFIKHTKTAKHIRNDKNYRDEAKQEENGSYKVPPKTPIFPPKMAKKGPKKLLEEFDCMFCGGSFSRKDNVIPTLYPHPYRPW